MNIRTQISERLWEAIAGAYDAGNYAHAVLESMHVVTTVLREKSGLDGDGNQLVGQALGGDNPKIRLNSLQTDTERNIQKGFEGILRGMYSAIRNPRSHEAATDRREHADAIIFFVNYLLTILDAGKEAFTAESFMERVSDADFVNSPRYSSLLVAEVPPARVGDALIAVYQGRRQLPLQNRGTLVLALLKAASEPQVDSLLAVVSNDLKTTNDPADIRTALQFLTPEIWPRLDEATRIRIENKLITGIRNGKINPTGASTEPLATWARDFVKAFTLRSDVATVLWLSLASDDAGKRQYVTTHFFGVLPDVAHTEQEKSRLVKSIARAVKEDDQHVRGALLQYINSFPSLGALYLCSYLRNRLTSRIRQSSSAMARPS